MRRSAGLRGAAPPRRNIRGACFSGTETIPGASKTLMTGCEDDKSLVQACRAGQTEAFGVLVRRNQDRLYPTILRLLGSPEDAQDILQDSFVRAFEKLDQFHGESSFYTWIYRIAVNLALSEYRRHRHRGGDRRSDAASLSLAAEPEDDSPETDPAVALERVERELIIQSALNELGPEHKAVVVLKDFDGMRYEEIASLLGIPIGTVRSRLHRARCELRERLRSLVDLDVAGASSQRDVQK